MGPRKKSKTSHPQGNQGPQTSHFPSTFIQSDDGSTSLPSGNNRSESITTAVSGAADTAMAPDSADRQVSNKKSWYGSWAQKSRPLSQIETENVPAERPPTAASMSQRRPSISTTPSSPRRYLSGKDKGSIRGIPLETSMSKVTVSSSKGHTTEDQKSGDGEETQKTEEVEPPLPPDPHQVVDLKDGSSKRLQTSSGWFGWWSRPDGYVEKDGIAKDSTKEEAESMDVAQGTPLPGVTPTEEMTDAPVVSPASVDKGGSESAEGPAPTVKAQLSSWFWFWSRSQNAQHEPPTETNDQPVDGKDADVNKQADDKQVDDKYAKDQANGEPKAAVETASKPLAAEESTTGSGTGTPEQAPKRRKSTGWAFWSREKPGQETPGDGPVHKQIGELAVADTPSQSHPEVAQFNEQEEPKKIPSQKKKTSHDTKPVKESETTSQVSTPSKVTPAPSPAIKSVEAPLASAKQPTKQVSKDQTRPNLLLPEFRSTYSLAHEPSFWEQIRQFFLRGEAENPHLHILPTPPRVKKALAIGVHGFFPSPIFQKVLGPPTGTSIRFANAAASAIKQWTEGRGYECDIEKVALEGEGLISERVDTLWKLLLNWIDHIREADFILIACHSQGVPVAIMLLAKLLEFGCANASRIGVCAMAGVNLGPFVDYKTRIFGGTALELFEFSNPTSKVSQMYQAALDTVLRHGVRILYVGSIDDQLVSLESSTFSNVSHPYIYRAVFVDGRIHTADFITHLVGFALKLRNLGLPDHGLIRELSPALAGSIYTGEGHSRLYDDLAVYNLAVSHALETTSLNAERRLTVREYEGPPGFKEGNPFFLPWAMRGVLEEEKVRKELGEECRELLALFEEWRPISKGLKDVRFRLEVLKSKL